MPTKPPSRSRRPRRLPKKNIIPSAIPTQEVYNAQVLSRIEAMAHVGSFRWKPAIGRIALSAELHHMFFRSTAQFDGTLERFLEFFHREDGQEMLETLRRALRKEQPFRTQLRIVRPNKEVRTLDMAGNVIPDADGNAMEVYCICRDITEERNSETRLLQSEARFRLLVERMKEYAIYMLDTDGCITTWNEHAERIKGYSAEEIIGEHISRFYTPEEVQQGRPELLLRRAKQHGRAEDEGWRVRKDGSLYWANVIITGLWDDSGKLRGFGKLTHDMTEQRLTERTLRESQGRLNAMFEHSPSMIFMKDKEGRYIDCNPPFAALCGRPREEVIGKTDAELFSPKQANEFIFNDQLVLEQGKPMKFEETAQHADGPHISIVMKFPMRDATGTVFGIGGIVTDITKRKRAEVALQQLTGKLIQLQDAENEHLAKELESGPAKMLAELRAQLAELLNSSAPLDEQTISKLEHSLGLAHDAMREVQAFSRLLYPPVLDEKGLLEALEEYQQTFSTKSGIKVLFELPATLPKLTLVAERTLFRVVQESLTNAHRHSGGNTVILRVMLTPREITLTINDNGNGIPAGVVNMESGHVFSSGVGILGMMERMRRLGGELRVNSGDWGTIVSASLPLPETNSLA